MRVQGGSTAAAGPLGALPVPVPMREDTPIARMRDGTGTPAPVQRATVHGPLVLAAAQPATAASPAPVPRVDAARAYARAPSGTPPAATGRAVSLSV